MGKKYQIINLNTDVNSSNECTIFYLLYIVLFFVIVFIIYKILFRFNPKEENFDNTSLNNNPNNNSSKNTQVPPSNNNSSKNTQVPPSNNNNNNSSKNTLNDLEEKNKELNMIRNTLENKLIEQTQAIYRSQNFNKIDSSSSNDEISYLLSNFANTKFPELNMDGKKIISSESELKNVLADVKRMKNIYVPGDIVTENSTFGISKDDICYRHNNKPIKPTPEFIRKYPNCMVCEVETTKEDKELKDTLGWKHTKTNISKVCLYDPMANDKSGIPNLSQCKTFCNIKK
jgi:hypothetical protein